MEYIRERGQIVKSIINNDVTGESRDVMTSIARVLNHEVSIAEAMNDTDAVLKFASRITERRAASKIDLHKADKEMVLSNSDYTTGFLPHIAHHVSDSEYEGFRSVPKHSTIHLKLSVRMYGVDHVFQRSSFRNSEAVDELHDLTRERKLFLAPVFEEKKLMKKRIVGAAGPIVSRVGVYAMGGGDWGDYLHARLQQCVMKLSELEKRDAGWTELRVVLKLIPELARFCNNPSSKQSHELSNPCSVAQPTNISVLGRMGRRIRGTAILKRRNCSE